MNIGIDLGTSYSSVAAEVNGKIEMIRVSTGASAFGDSFSMPTAVYMDNGHVLLGQAALSKRKLSPSSFKSEFKRDFGTTTPYIIDGEEYLPEQLYTELLLYFKEQAVKQTGEKIEKVYITHPANYGNNKKRLIEKAANNAGLFDVALVDEPTAAAAGYAKKNKIIDGDILLVYDLGGGTFDAALIKKTAKRYIHLTEPLGISQCGGIDFDRVIFEDIIHKMTQSGDFDIDRVMKEKRFIAALSEISIQIKHQLSQTESHTESIAVGFDYFEYTIKRQEFENMIRPLVSNTYEKVKDILKNSGLVASDIDRVLLVGGSSRVPLVKKMVQETLYKDISLDADPELAVCQGAVSLGSMKQQEVIGIDNSSADKPMDEWGTLEKVEKQQKGNFLLKRADVVENHEIMRRLMVDLMFGSIAADDDWIYYLGHNSALYKIKTDGTQMTKLSYCRAVYPVKIEGEWIYYRVKENVGNKCNFYRIKKCGTEETRISREYTNEMDYKYAVKDDWIYFTNSNGYLTKVRTDGSCIASLGDDTNVRQVNLENDWIYYTSSSRNFTSKCLCRISIDGTKRTVICLYSSMDKIVVSGDWIIYKSSNYKEDGLWKTRVDGTGKSQICEGHVDSFNIIGDWLYYEIYSYNEDYSRDCKIFRSYTDGSGLEIVNF